MERPTETSFGLTNITDLERRMSVEFASRTTGAKRIDEVGAQTVMLSAQPQLS
jgi:hypothetical protein